MTNELNPTKVLANAIGHIRQDHQNTYSWTLPISDEDAIDILSNKIVELS